MVWPWLMTKLWFQVNVCGLWKNVFSLGDIFSADAIKLLMFFLFAHFFFFFSSNVLHLKHYYFYIYHVTCFVAKNVFLSDYYCHFFVLWFCNTYVCNMFSVHLFFFFLRWRIALLFLVLSVTITWFEMSEMSKLLLWVLWFY